MRSVITAADIPRSGELKIPKGAIVTSAAQETAEARGVRIVEASPQELASLAPPENTIALGADHGGFRMKEELKPVLKEFGFAVRDVGIHEEKAADYPDIAEEVAELVAGEKAARGIIVDGAGIGSCMAANKVPGVRAALCYDKASARNSREHNDSNVLTLGGRMLTQSQAEDVVRTWLSTPFGGGRHASRVNKITALEQKYSKWTQQR